MSDLGLRTHEERVAALCRDQERMRLPEGYDGHAVVLAALKSWREKREARLRAAVQRAKRMRRRRWALRWAAIRAALGRSPERIAAWGKTIVGGSRW